MRMLKERQVGGVRKEKQARAKAGDNERNEEGEMMKRFVRVINVLYPMKGLIYIICF